MASYRWCISFVYSRKICTDDCREEPRSASDCLSRSVPACSAAWRSIRERAGSPAESAAGWECGCRTPGCRTRPRSSSRRWECRRARCTAPSPESAASRRQCRHICVYRSPSELCRPRFRKKTNSVRVCRRDPANSSQVSPAPESIDREPVRQKLLISKKKNINHAK